MLAISGHAEIPIGGLDLPLPLLGRNAAVLGALMDTKFIAVGLLLDWPSAFRLINSRSA
jgi:hypothetical protein